MRIDYQSKNYKAKESLKEVIDKKIQRLDKYFDEDVTVKVMMRESKNIETMELTIFLGSTVLRAEVSGEVGQTMYDLIDIVIPKLEKQIKKHHTILASKSKKFRQKVIVENIKAEEKQTSEIVRTKSFDLTAMDEIEAMAELELIGHSFYVFLNKATDKVNVIYKRNDGNYGIIEANV
ncbi:MAG TPA: ribosome-associated translation inhibitor RaiA [Firmicutes bacterium]|nr:ribosome-associated translation inhibitor RaiA [Bacillota bacterium]